MREHAAEGPAPAVTDDAAVAVAPAPPLAAPLTPSSLLGLQRHAGNRAVTALLAREPAAATLASLRSGSTGPEVTRLQMDLNLLDEVKTALAVDAIYGPITAGAVREFQAAHPPLKATGVADAGTQSAIEAAKAEEQDQTEIGRKLFALGAKAYDQRKFAHAYAFFTRAHELTGRANLLFSRAQSLRRLGGRREEAIALYEEYLASDDPSRKEDAEAALAELTVTKTGDETTDTDTGRQHYNKGAGLYEGKDYAHAYDQFTMAYELTGRSNLLFSRAQALRRLGGRRDEAIALYEQYLASDSPSRKEDAEAALAELTVTKTGEEEADTATGRQHYNKGAGLYEGKDYAHAYDQFTMAYELTGRSNLLFSRAQALRRLGGRSDEAIALYEQYIEAGGDRVEDAKLMLELLRTHGAAP